MQAILDIGTKHALYTIKF